VELLELGIGTSSGEMFTLGLFSVIDAMLNTPIDEILERIPFPSDMRLALANHSGEKGQLLQCVTALEASDFDRALALVPGAGDLHLASLGWANDAAGPLYDPPALATASAS
jgi:c-di-GMP phosphodiesterase